WLSVESLSDRVRNLRTESASQSSLNAAAASPTAGAAESSNDEGLGDAFNSRGSALKASRKRQAVRAQRLQAQEDETGQQKPLTQRTNCAFKTGPLNLSRPRARVRPGDRFGSAIDDSVAADYGTGVGAFFTIYRQLAMATVLSAMSIFFFLVFPQLRPKGFGRSAYADIRPQSLLYYGAYSNKTLDGSGYDLKNAYFFTGTRFLIFNLICVAKMLTTAVQDHYVESSGELRGSSLICYRETAVQIGKHQRQTGFSDRASSLLQLLAQEHLSAIESVAKLWHLFCQHNYRLSWPSCVASGSGLFTLATVASLAFVLHAFIFCHSSEAESDSNYFTCRVLGHSQLHDGWSVTSEANEFCWSRWNGCPASTGLTFTDFFAALVSSFFSRFCQRLGAFFSPPLAVFGALKILTLFFYKWLILQLCFRPSLAGHGQAADSQDDHTFLFLTSLVPGLFLSFSDLLSCPCRPPAARSATTALLKDAYFDQSNLVGFVRYVTTGTPQVLLLCLFLTMLVRVRSVAMGKEDAIRALKRYIVLVRCLSLCCLPE
uniref:Transmembrane protein n=1 Tax=Macrostomum lignano TaxID=282301 RepID=A0A1I8FLL0_9PLAT